MVIEPHSHVAAAFVQRQLLVYLSQTSGLTNLAGHELRGRDLGRGAPIACMCIEPHGFRCNMLPTGTGEVS